MMKYIIFVLSTSALCLLIAIVMDLSVNGSVGSICDYKLEGFFVMAGIIALPAMLVIITLILGLLVYFKLNRNCCSTTSVRVPITLGVTSGLISIIAVVSLITAQVGVRTFFAVIPSCVVLEQVLLFILFLTSRTVRAKLSCKKKTAIITPSPVKL